MKNHIKALRKVFGFRQADLAQKVGITRQSIVAIENNKSTPTLEIAMKISKLFKKRVEDVFEL